MIVSESQIYSNVNGGVYNNLLNELVDSETSFSTIEAIRCKIKWICFRDHVEMASLIFRVRNGCKHCNLILKNKTALEITSEIAQFVDGKNLEILKNSHSKSRLKVECACPDCGFNWSMRIDQLVNGVGCYKCKQLKRDIVIDYTSLNQYWSIYNKNNCENLKLENYYFFTCKKYGESHSFESTLKRFINNFYSCDYCSNKRILKGFNDFMTVSKKLSSEYNWELNEEIDPYKLGIGSNVKLWWSCSNCSNNIKSGINERNAIVNSCKYCSNRAVCKDFNSNSIRFPNLLQLFSKENNIIFDDAVSNKVYLWKCKEFGHTFHNSLSNMSRGRINCRVCNNREIIEGVNDIRTVRPEILSEVNDGNDTVTNLKNREFIVEWRCKTFGHIYMMSIGKRLGGRDCPKCSYFGVSKLEKELSLFLDELKIEYENNTRKIIEGLELDFYFSGLKLAIEVNGDYWHSDSVIFKNSNNLYNAIDYHKLKLEKCLSKNINLVFIWEHDWVEHNDYVKVELLKFLYNEDYNKALFTKLESIMDTGECKYC